MAASNSSVVQGDTWTRTITYCNPLPNGQPDYTSPVDLTGYDVKLQVRKEPGAAAEFTLTSNPQAGITVIPEQGRITFRASPAQTSALAPGRWRFDLQIDNGVDRLTILGGFLTVEDQITT